MAIILQAPTGLCELPNPLEEDNEGLEAAIHTHTSITNITRVYRRTGGYRRFVMTFSLHPNQAKALKQFLKHNLGDWLVITDYRGRQHRAVITSNPVEFTAHKRHRESVTLEFLGVQI